jgi:hypothetical protein
MWNLQDARRRRQERRARGRVQGISFGELANGIAWALRNQPDKLAKFRDDLLIRLRNSQ